MGQFEVLISSLFDRQIETDAKTVTGPQLPINKIHNFDLNTVQLYRNDQIACYGNYPLNTAGGVTEFIKHLETGKQQNPLLMQKL